MELTQIGKLFFAGVLAWITRGAKLHFKIKGSPEQMQALTNAAFASKKYHDELANPQATVESIMEKINQKQQAAKAFEEATGTAWPI